MPIFFRDLVILLFSCCICFCGCHPTETSHQAGKAHQNTVETGLNSNCLPSKTANLLDIIVRDYGVTERASDIKKLVQAVAELKSRKEFSENAAETIVDFAQRLNDSGNDYSLPLLPNYFDSGDNTSDSDRVLEDSYRLAKYQDALHLLGAAEFEQGNYEACSRLLEHSLLVNQFQGQIGGTANWMKRCDNTLVNLVAVLRCCSNENIKPPASLMQKLEQIYDQANTDSTLVKALDWELHSRLNESTFDGHNFEELEQNQRMKLLSVVAKLTKANHDLDAIAWNKHPWIAHELTQEDEPEAGLLEINFAAVLNRELQRRVAIAIALAAVETSHDPGVQLSKQIKKRVDSLNLPANCVRYNVDHLVLVQFNEVDTSRELTVFNWAEDKIISYRREPSEN